MPLTPCVLNACADWCFCARPNPSCAQDDGGGGGGGDGWNWERTARNVLPNVVFLGMYFLITSYGGDGWGGGFFGGEWRPGGGGWGRKLSFGMAGEGGTRVVEGNQTRGGGGEGGLDEGMLAAAAAT